MLSLYINDTLNSMAWRLPFCTIPLNIQSPISHSNHAISPVPYLRSGQQQTLLSGSTAYMLTFNDCAYLHAPSWLHAALTTVGSINLHQPYLDHQPQCLKYFRHIQAVTHQDGLASALLRQLLLY